MMDKARGSTKARFGAEIPGRALLRRLRRPGIDQRSFQEKISGSIDERWTLFERAISPNARNALDIGSNLGDMAQHLAGRGLWTIGIESEQPLVQAAQERHREVVNLGFLQMKLDPQNIDLLPHFDVIFLLSVHHHWIHQHGREATGTMIRSLFERTNEVLIFEGASRRSRYGSYSPDFVDNDEASVTRFHTQFLTEFLGESASRIDSLGKTRALGEREPYRWSWAVYR